MKGFVANIEELSLENDNFRKVLYTSNNSQLVLMSLEVGEEIGEEIHDEEDQFLRVEKGTGKVILEGVVHELVDGSSVVVPKGVKHNIINTGNEAMKLYTLYMPPHHRDGMVHKTKAEAESNEEHFDGITSE
jgi:mannose-6-phosphate isomerase-like protein (cupin superfamily)